jgi:UDP-sulfoquinovose synthase
MKALILGADGYIGWPLTLHLASKGHDLWAIDDLSRRGRGTSIIPIGTYGERLDAFKEEFGKDLPFSISDVEDSTVLAEHLKVIRPDVIIHLAQQPSAPFSMASHRKAYQTLIGNLQGTLNLLWCVKQECPAAHIIKLGSMGEYGTPGVLIREEPTFPRDPGSLYHASKVNDSVMIRLACKLWGLRCTDIMQGIVYGTQIEAMGGMGGEGVLATRLDYDEMFGTVVNRFCVQAVAGYPLTVYGGGGQIRSFIPLGDVMQCIELLMENYPAPYEYRVVNQFHGITQIDELADIVMMMGNELGLDVRYELIANPRVEEEDHRYVIESKVLKGFGYVPGPDMSDTVEGMLLDILPFKDRIDRSVIAPTVNFRL